MKKKQPENTEKSKFFKGRPELPCANSDSREKSEVSPCPMCMAFAKEQSAFPSIGKALCAVPILRAMPTGNTMNTGNTVFAHYARCARFRESSAVASHVPCQQVYPRSSADLPPLQISPQMLQTPQNHLHLRKKHVYYL
jgi:hypothetical protein